MKSDLFILFNTIYKTVLRQKNINLRIIFSNKFKIKNNINFWFVVYYRIRIVKHLYKLINLMSPERNKNLPAYISKNNKLQSSTDYYLAT